MHIFQGRFDAQVNNLCFRVGITWTLRKDGLCGSPKDHQPQKSICFSRPLGNQSATLSPCLAVNLEAASFAQEQPWATVFTQAGGPMGLLWAARVKLSSWAPNLLAPTQPKYLYLFIYWASKYDFIWRKVFAAIIHKWEDLKVLKKLSLVVFIFCTISGNFPIFAFCILRIFNNEKVVLL